MMNITNCPISNVNGMWEKNFNVNPSIFFGHFFPLITVTNDQNIQHFSPLNPSVLPTYLIHNLWNFFSSPESK